MRKQLQRAFTLIEMLIAMALTLILVFAVAEFYAYVGTAVRDSRALIEMGGQLRAASQQLHDDLNSLTLRPKPWIDPASSPGYFSIYEGPYSDSRPDGMAGGVPVTDISADVAPANKVPDAIERLNITTLIGDGDDILAMTIRAKDVPFQGQVWNGSTYVPVSSQYAEVIWYTTFDDLDGDNSWDINEPRFLCRRQLLIVPTLGNLAMPGALANFYQQSEVSFNVSGGQPVANSLSDLSLRHNRFGCQGQNLPAPMQINPSNAPSVRYYSLADDTANSPPRYQRFGEDRVLANLLAFDVRVFDPEARIYQSNGVALTAGDLGYPNAASQETRDPLAPGSYAPYPPQETVPLPVVRTNWPNVQGLGAWVDLNYNRGLLSEPGARTAYTQFSGQRPAPPGGYVAPSLGYSVWDTWPTSYLMPPYGNGQAFDGLDNDNANGVDDPGERTPAQSRPPYAFPLRGVQVRLRIYEPQTRQARQVTVGADFVAE